MPDTITQPEHAIILRSEEAGAANCESPLVQNCDTARIHAWSQPAFSVLSDQTAAR